MDDPRIVWLSDNFRLSDFLGNNSVYSQGMRNPYQGGALHLRNAEALCAGLEIALASFGPLSISYGYICQEFSRATVKYQDPDKPSHHQWNLGAAADIRLHDMVDAQDTSPAHLLHLIDAAAIPYSRLISYSESPFLCLAVSAAELEEVAPRKAMYENCYEGVPKRKPEYLQLHRPRARATRLRELQEQGLPADWRGAGYPTYHGGGIKQLQHTQVSRYTTALDWCVSFTSIRHSMRNRPDLMKDATLDNLAAAGLFYDYLQQHAPARGPGRISILSGYKAEDHPEFDPDYPWTQPGPIVIELSGADEEASDRMASLAEDMGMAVLGVDEGLQSVSLRISADQVFEALEP